MPANTWSQQSDLHIVFYLFLQLMLWADGGRFGRNSLLGVAIIWLDDLEFSKVGNDEIGGWYKLFLSKFHPTKNISP